MTDHDLRTAVYVVASIAVAALLLFIPIWLDSRKSGRTRK